MGARSRDITFVVVMYVVTFLGIASIAYASQQYTDVKRDKSSTQVLPSTLPYRYFLPLIAMNSISIPIFNPHFPFAYGPYRSGQMPGGVTPSPSEIDQDMIILRQETNYVRTYGACNELFIIPSIANSHGFYLYQGVSLTSTLMTTGTNANNQEMSCYNALKPPTNSNIVAGVIGNEVLLQGLLSEAQLVTYVNQAKGGVPGTIGEPWNVWCNNAAPCQSRASLGTAVDFVLAHSHPFWESSPIEHAAPHVVATYIALHVTYPNQTIIIGETGWPTCGNANGLAVPSLANQRHFIEEIWPLSNAYKIPIFYFEAFDEEWKPSVVERCWGFFYADRVPKHSNLNWATPTPFPIPALPFVRIEHPRGMTTTTTNSNCTVPIIGKAYNTASGWRVKVEVFTDQWYPQGKWFANGEAPIVDGAWGMPEIYLAGLGAFNNHQIRASLLDQLGNVMATDQVNGIVRSNSCTPS